MLSKDYYPLSPALDAAFKESRPAGRGSSTSARWRGSSAQMMILMRGMLPAGQTLDKVVSPATFRLVSERAKSLGLPIEPLKRFKPWALALTLLGAGVAKAGFRRGTRPRQALLRRGGGRRARKCRGSKQSSSRISRFDEHVRWRSRSGCSRRRCPSSRPRRRHVTTLADAWKAGDAPTVERIVLQELRKEPADVPAAAGRPQQELAAEDRGPVRPQAAAPSSSSARRTSSAPTDCSPCSRPRATPSNSSSAPR